MTRPIRRGIPFPSSYGRNLPLPSDINSHQEVVLKLTALWIEIADRGLLGDRHKETVSRIVNNFFDQLSPEEKEWLEGYDSLGERSRKSRAILVKEHAIQISQRGEQKDFLNDPEVREAQRKIREIIIDVIGNNGSKEAKRR